MRISGRTNKPLRRRLQLALRYHAREWHDRSLAERVKYITSLLLWYLLLLPLRLLILTLAFFVDRTSRRGRVGNTFIIDEDEESGPTFGRVTIEALHLIERVDPRRYRRIQREVRVIENSVTTQLGSYRRDGYRCKINFSRFACTWEDPTDYDYRWFLYYYATILIHEATHGHFDSLGIPYTRKTRADIERLCVQESHRFVLRALRLSGSDEQLADALVPPFRAEKWEKSWHQSRWQRAKENWRAITRKKEARQ